MLHSRQSWFLHLFVFTLIYIEFGYHMVVVNQIPGTLRMLILLAMTALLFLVGDKRIAPKTLFLFLYFVVLLLLNLIIRCDNYSNYLLMIIPICIGYIVSCSVKHQVFVRVFCDVVYFLAMASLAVYSVNLAFPNFISMLPTINVLPSGAQIHDAFFAVAITKSINVRNYGLTWEPGAFALLLCLALYFLLVYDKKTRPTRLIIITTAIITTFSTLGYLFTAVVYMVFFLNVLKDRTKFSRKKTTTIVAIVCLLVLGFVFMPQHLKGLVFLKLNSLFANGDSASFTTQARINAIVYPVQAFFQSPLTGVGYDRFQYINEIRCNSVATNTIANWFALFGLPFGLPCTYYYLKNVLIDRSKTRFGISSCVLLLVAFCFLISTESLLRISLVYILIFYAANSNRVKGEQDVSAA